MPASLPHPNPTKSFWHSEPSEFLLGHRTTADLPSAADVVVIGTGITGTSAAKFLAANAASTQSLKSIVVLEAREACWGATGRNGGHCQPLFLARSADVGAFELKNYEYVKSFVAENSIQCEWRSSSSCHSFWTDELASMAKNAVEEFKKHSPELGKRIRFTADKDDLTKACIPDAPAATLTEGAASLWPYKLVSWILEKLVKDGKINLQTNTPVTKLSSLSSSDNAKSHRWTVETPRGAVQARHVILATNGYTSHLLPDFDDLIVPVRGEMSALYPPSNVSLLPKTYGFLGTRGSKAHHDDYLNQRPVDLGGHYMFGGGMEAGTLPTVGVTDDSVIDEATAQYLKETLLMVMKLPADTDGIKQLKAQAVWTGIMGFSRDDNPWIGAVPETEGLWIAAGYSGHGMPNGTLCGKAVADMVTGEEKGESREKVNDWLVTDQGLPKGYLVSKERIDKARKLSSVAEARTQGLNARHSDGFWRQGINP